MNAWRSKEWGVGIGGSSADTIRGELGSSSLIMDWQSKRNKWWIRTVALLVVICFIYQDIVYAQGGTPVWQQAKVDSRQNGKVLPNDIRIPYDSGKIETAVSNNNINGNKEVIINIQDAHASLAAQESIVNILDTLTKNYDLNVIALEGAEGPVDISLLRTFPDKTVRKEAAEYLMRQGKMSAGEFFSITNEKPIKLYGIENDSLYQENIEAFKKMMDKKALCAGQTEKLIAALEALEPKVYSDDLRQLNKNSILHRDGKLSFTAHWDFVSKLARRNNIEIKIFDNLSRLLETIELEKEIDFNKANAERKALIDELSKVLPKRELEKLVLESLNFKMGKISQGEFHQYLVRLAEEAKVPPQNYSNLIKFSKYITIYEGIDLAALFREVDEFEAYIREKIFRNDEERQLYNLTKTARIMKKLFEASLDNGDYEFIAGKIKSVDRSSFSDFIKNTYAKYDISFDAPYDLDTIFSNLDEAMSFYNIAQKRNNAMLSNTINAMRKNNEQVAALITGGFHSEGLASLVKNKGLSYLVIMPKFKDGVERPYITILTNKKQPYEDLIESGKYLLAFRAYCYTGDARQLCEFLFASYGREYLNGKAIEPLIIEHYKEFKAAFSQMEKERAAWQNSKTPFTPENFRDVFGLEEDGAGNVTFKGGRTGIDYKKVKVGAENIVLINKYNKEGSLELSLALTTDAKGKINLGLVPQEAIAKARDNKEDAVKAAIHEIRGIEAKEKLLALLSAKAKALSTQDRKSRRDIIGKYAEDGDVEALARRARQKGFQISSRDVQDKDFQTAVNKIIKIAPAQRRAYIYNEIAKQGPDRTWTVRQAAEELARIKAGEFSHTTIYRDLEKLVSDGMLEKIPQVKVQGKFQPALYKLKGPSEQPQTPPGPTSPAVAPLPAITQPVENISELSQEELRIKIADLEERINKAYENSHNTNVNISKLDPDIDANAITQLKAEDNIRQKNINTMEARQRQLEAALNEKETTSLPQIAQPGKVPPLLNAILSNRFVHRAVIILAVFILNGFMFISPSTAAVPMTMKSNVVQNVKASLEESSKATVPGQTRFIIGGLEYVKMGDVPSANNVWYIKETGPEHKRLEARSNIIIENSVVKSNGELVAQFGYFDVVDKQGKKKTVPYFKYAKSDNVNKNYKGTAYLERDGKTVWINPDSININNGVVTAVSPAAEKKEEKPVVAVVAVSEAKAPQAEAEKPSPAESQAKQIMVDKYVSYIGRVTEVVTRHFGTWGKGWGAYINYKTKFMAWEPSDVSKEDKAKIQDTYKKLEAEETELKKAIHVTCARQFAQFVKDASKVSSPAEYDTLRSSFIRDMNAFLGNAGNTTSDVGKIENAAFYKALADSEKKAQDALLLVEGRGTPTYFTDKETELYKLISEPLRSNLHLLRDIEGDQFERRAREWALLANIQRIDRIHDDWSTRERMRAAAGSSVMPTPPGMSGMYGGGGVTPYTGSAQAGLRLLNSLELAKQLAQNPRGGGAEKAEMYTRDRTAWLNRLQEQQAPTQNMGQVDHILPQGPVSAQTIEAKRSLSKFLTIEGYAIGEANAGDYALFGSVDAILKSLYPEKKNMRQILHEVDANVLRKQVATFAKHQEDIIRDAKKFFSNKTNQNEMNEFSQCPPEYKNKLKWFVYSAISGRTKLMEPRYGSMVKGLLYVVYDEDWSRPREVLIFDKAKNEWHGGAVTWDDNLGARGEWRATLLLWDSRKKTYNSEEISWQQEKDDVIPAQKQEAGHVFIYSLERKRASAEIVERSPGKFETRHFDKYNDKGDVVQQHTTIVYDGKDATIETSSVSLNGMVERQYAMPEEVWNDILSKKLFGKDDKVKAEEAYRDNWFKWDDWVKDRENKMKAIDVERQKASGVFFKPGERRIPPAVATKTPPPEAGAAVRIMPLVAASLIAQSAQPALQVPAVEMTAKTEVVTASAEQEKPGPAARQLKLVAVTTEASSPSESILKSDSWPTNWKFVPDGGITGAKLENGALHLMPNLSAQNKKGTAFINFDNNQTRDLVGKKITIIVNIPQSFVGNGNNCIQLYVKDQNNKWQDSGWVGREVKKAGLYTLEYTPSLAGGLTHAGFDPTKIREVGIVLALNNELPPNFACQEDIVVTGMTIETKASVQESIRRENVWLTAPRPLQQVSPAKFADLSGISCYAKEYEGFIGTTRHSSSDIADIFAKSGNFTRLFLTIGSKSSSGIVYKDGIPDHWDNAQMAINHLINIVRAVPDGHSVGLVLHDFRIANKPYDVNDKSTYDDPGHPMILTTDEGMKALVRLDRELLEGAFKQLTSAERGKIAFLEFWNEPDNSNPDINVGRLQKAISLGNDMIREIAPGTPISMGTSNIENIGLYSWMLKPGDIWQIHAYPDKIQVVEGGTFQGKMVTIATRLNVPDGAKIMLGEVPAYDKNGTLAVADVLTAAYNSGLSGTAFWYDNKKRGSDVEFRFDEQAAKAYKDEITKLTGTAPAEQAQPAPSTVTEGQAAPEAIKKEEPAKPAVATPAPQQPAPETAKKEESAKPLAAQPKAGALTFRTPTIEELEKMGKDALTKNMNITLPIEALTKGANISNDRAAYIADQNGRVYRIDYDDPVNPTKMYVTSSDMKMFINGEEEQMWDVFNVTPTEGGRGRVIIYSGDMRKAERRIKVFAGSDHKIASQGAGILIGRIGHSPDGEYEYVKYVKDPNLVFSAAGKAYKYNKLDTEIPYMDLAPDNITIGKDGKVSVGKIEINGVEKTEEKSLATYYKDTDPQTGKPIVIKVDHVELPVTVDGKKKIVTKDKKYIYDMESYGQVSSMRQMIDIDGSRYIYAYDNLEHPAWRISTEAGSSADIGTFFELAYKTDGDVDDTNSHARSMRSGVKINPNNPIVAVNAGEHYAYLIYRKVSGNDKESYHYTAYTSTVNAQENLRGRVYRALGSRHDVVEAMVNTNKVEVRVTDKALHHAELHFAGEVTDTLAEEHALAARFKHDEFGRITEEINYDQKKIKRLHYKEVGAEDKVKFNPRVESIDEIPFGQSDAPIETRKRTFIYETKTNVLNIDTKLMKLGRLAGIVEPDGFQSKEIYYKDGDALVVMRDYDKAGILARILGIKQRVKPATVVVPLAADGKLLDQSRPFKIYNAAIPSFDLADTVTPDGVLVLTESPEQGARTLIEQAWVVLGALPVFPEDQARNIEDNIFAHIKKAFINDYSKFINTQGVTIDAFKVLEKEIWGETDNLVNAYREAKEANSIDMSGYIRWGRFVKARFNAFQDVSYKELFINKGEVTAYCDNLRFVLDGILVKLEADEVASVFRIFNHSCTEIDVETPPHKPTPVSSYEIDFTNNAALAADTTDNSGNKVRAVDMTNREIEVIIRSHSPEKETPLNIVCVDANGGERTFTARIQGDKAFNLLTPEDKAKLVHRIEFAPSTADGRYTITVTPPFDLTKVVKLRIENSIDLNLLDINVRVETILAPPSLSRLPEIKNISYLENDAAAKAVAPLGVSKKREREIQKEKITGVPVTRGELSYNLTDSGKPIDLRNVTHNIEYQLPEHYRHEGIEVEFSYYDKMGGSFSQKGKTNEDGIVSLAISPTSKTDFDAGSVIAFTARFEMRGEAVGEAVIKSPFTTSISVISIIALIAGFFRGLFRYLFFTKTAKKNRKIEEALEKNRIPPLGPGGEPLQTPPVIQQPAQLVPRAQAQAQPQQPVIPPNAQQAASAAAPQQQALDDDQLLARLEESIDKKGINGWVDQIGVDFRMTGSQQEDRGIFMPWFRPNEPWEFSDQGIVPRYNRSMVMRYLVLAVTGTAFYFGVPFLGDFSFSAYPGLIHFYPYVLLLMLSGVLNWGKLLTTVGLGSVFFACQWFIPQLSLSVSPTLVSFALAAGIMVFDIARQYVLYYRAAANPENYIVAQKRELQKLKDILLSIQNDTPLMNRIESLRRFKRSRDLSEWDKQQYEGGAVVKIEPFKDTLREAINEVNGLLNKKPDYDKFAGFKGKVIAVGGLIMTGSIGATLAAFLIGLIGLPVFILASVSILISYLVSVAIIVGHRARSLMLITPAFDMKNIYKDYQRYVNNTETGKNLGAIDVRRFLVEIRAAANRIYKHGQVAGTEDLQGSLDTMRDGMVNVRDTATVRDFMDTFHLTKLESWGRFIPMAVRVSFVVFVFVVGSYVACIAGIISIRQLFSLIGGDGLLSYGQLFEHSFAVVDILKEGSNWAPTVLNANLISALPIVLIGTIIASIITLRFTRNREDSKGMTIARAASRIVGIAATVALIGSALTITSSWANPYFWKMLAKVPLALAQTFFGAFMLSSIVLFAQKFIFYDLGKYAKVYPGQQFVSQRQRAGYTLTFFISAILLTAMISFGVSGLWAGYGGHFAALAVKIALIGALLLSTWKLVIMKKAAMRYKAICEDDKLYDGREDNDLTDIENTRRNIDSKNTLQVQAEVQLSYDKFIETFLGKYEPKDIALLARVNALKHEHYNPDPKSQDYWKNRLGAEDRRAVMRYETLFGKGGEPSGTIYEGLETVVSATCDNIINNITEEEFGAFKYYLERNNIRFNRGVTFDQARQHPGVMSGIAIDVMQGFYIRVLLERAYRNLTTEQIVQRMSGAGFKEIQKKFRMDKNLTLWAVQKEPDKLNRYLGENLSDRERADKLREYFDGYSMNEKKIIVMYDLLPKFTPWIVVVAGADALFKLLNALIGFRYPLNKLKFVFAGENWDMEVQNEVRKRHSAGDYPPQLIFRGMAAREDGRTGEPAQAYTKPGANTSVLDASDGINGIIYDAENIPSPNQILQLVLGTMDGVAKVRHLVNARFEPALRGKFRMHDNDNVETIIRNARSAVRGTVDDYTADLEAKGDENARRDLELHYQFNFKTKNILKRHLTYFVNHQLRTLLNLTEQNERYFSTALLFEHINSYIGDNRPGRKRERRELINLYISLCNMPGYGELADAYLRGEMPKADFIKGLIIGQYRLINEPKNGQGRLVKINTALHRSPGQVSAYMYGEYASWYTAGWDGFMAAQDTFKPLGGTTGYFCTEPVEEIDWKDEKIIKRLKLNETIDSKREGTVKPVLATTIIEEHYRLKNKLLTLGAWDEYQVAEDYMLGFVSWYYGFNIAAFYSLTPEDPAGLESGLTFKYRPKQMSRWIKGYIIGLLVIAEEGNFRDLIERKGWWGAMVFFVPTFCSAIHPIMFRIARVLTTFWWTHFIPISVIGGALLSSSLGPVSVFINNLTGVGTFLLDFQQGVDIAIPQILPFLPPDLAWGVGPAIVIIPIFIHRFFTMRGILRGVNDFLGRRRIIGEYDEWIEDLIGSKEHPKAGSIVTLYAEIEALNNRGLNELLSVIGHRVAEYKELINRDQDQALHVRAAIDDLRDAVNATGHLNANVIVGKLDALKELVDRREIIRAGDLKEITGVISPRRYTFGIAVFLSAFLGTILAEPNSIPFISDILPSPTIILSLGFIALTAGILLLWSRPKESPVPMWQKVGGTVILVLAIVPLIYWPVFAPWLLITALGTLVIYVGAMYIGQNYIRGAGTVQERSVRVIRFRTMMANFFIDFYHMLYLSGNQIAWGEVMNGGRIGYWWRTPRPVGILNEVVERYAPVKIDTPDQLVMSRDADGTQVIEIKSGDLSGARIKFIGRAILDITDGRTEPGTLQLRDGGHTASIQLRNNASLLVSRTTTGGNTIWAEKYEDRNKAKEKAGKVPQKLSYKSKDKEDEVINVTNGDLKGVVVEISKGKIVLIDGVGVDNCYNRPDGKSAEITMKGGKKYVIYVEPEQIVTTVDELRNRQTSFFTPFKRSSKVDKAAFRPEQNIIVRNGYDRTRIVQITDGDLKDAYVSITYVKSPGGDRPDIGWTIQGVSGMQVGKCTLNSKNDNKTATVKIKDGPELLMSLDPNGNINLTAESMKGEPRTLEEELEDARLLIQLVLNYSFMVIMFLLVGIGLRDDIRNYMFGEGIMETIGRSSVNNIWSIAHIYGLTIAVLTAVSIGGFLIIRNAVRNQRSSIRRIALGLFTTVMAAAAIAAGPAIKYFKTPSLPEEYMGATGILQIDIIVYYFFITVALIGGVAAISYIIYRIVDRYKSSQSDGRGMARLPIILTAHIPRPTTVVPPPRTTPPRAHVQPATHAAAAEQAAENAICGEMLEMILAGDAQAFTRDTVERLAHVNLIRSIGILVKMRDDSRCNQDPALGLREYINEVLHEKLLALNTNPRLGGVGNNRPTPEYVYKISNGPDDIRSILVIVRTRFAGEDSRLVMTVARLLEESCQYAIRQSRGRQQFEPVKPIGAVLMGLSMFGLIVLIAHALGVDLSGLAQLGIGSGILAASGLGFIYEGWKHAKARMDKRNIDIFRKTQGTTEANGWGVFGDNDELAVLDPVLDELGIPKDMVRPLVWTNADMPDSWLKAFLELFRTSPPKIASSDSNYIYIAPSLLKPENRSYLKQILRHEFAHMNGAREIGATFAERGWTSFLNLRFIYNIIPLIVNALIPPSTIDIMDMTREERLAIGENNTDRYLDLNYSRHHVERVSRIAECIGKHMRLSEGLMNILMAAAETHDGGYCDPGAYAAVTRYHGGSKLMSQDRAAYPTIEFFLKHLTDNKGGTLTAGEETLARDLYNHEARAIYDITQRGIAIPLEVELLIRHHQFPAEMSKDIELYKDKLSVSPEDLQLLLAIIFTADIFENGNNVDKMHLSRGGRPAETFDQTFAFLNRSYSQEGITDLRPLQALAELIGQEDPELFMVVSEGRRESPIVIKEADKTFIAQNAPSLFMPQFQVAFFDWDGTISDTEIYTFKTFVTLYPQIIAGGTEADGLAVFKEKNMSGMPLAEQYKVLSAIAAEKGIELGMSELEYGRRFDALKIEMIGNSTPEVSGSSEFIKYLISHGVKVYIVSGMVRGELLKRVEAFGIAGIVSGVYGAPSNEEEASRFAANKAEYMQRVLGEEQIAPTEAVMFGDTIYDMQAANKAGIMSVGRAENSANADALRSTGAALTIADYKMPGQIMKSINEKIAKPLPVETDPRLLQHMDRVLEAAVENARENPNVIGAAGMLVDRNGSEVARGVQTTPSDLRESTGKKGEHAELNVLADAEVRGNTDWQNYTLVISWEPFDIDAKAIASRGIKKVVIAMLDPTKRDCGYGARTLLSAGVDVTIAPAGQQRRATDFVRERLLSRGVVAEKLLTTEESLARSVSPVRLWKKTGVDSLREIITDSLDNQSIERHNDFFDIYEFDRAVAHLLQLTVKPEGDRLPQVVAINANSFDASLGLPQVNNERLPKNQILWGYQAANPSRPLYTIIAGTDENCLKVIDGIYNEGLPLENLYVLKGLAPNEAPRLVSVAEFYQAQLRSPPAAKNVMDIDPEVLLNTRNHGYILRHARRETAICKLIGEKLKVKGYISDEQLKLLIYGSILHDLGADIRAVKNDLFNKVSTELKKRFPGEPSFKRRVNKLISITAEKSGEPISGRVDAEPLQRRLELFSNGLQAELGIEPAELKANAELWHSMVDVPSNTREKLAQLGLSVPRDLGLLLEYHNDLNGFMRDKPGSDNPASILGLFLTAIFLVDNFEHGNNAETQWNQRDHGLPENFQQTFAFIEKRFADERIEDRRALEALEALVVEENEELMQIVAKSRNVKRQDIPNSEDKKFIENARGIQRTETASIVLGVSGAAPEVIAAVNKNAGNVKLVALKGANEDENLKQLERARRNAGAYASGMIDAGIVSEERLSIIAADLANEIEAQDRSIFTIQNPETAKLTTETIDKIKDLHNILNQITERIPGIRSLLTSETSVYNLRMTNNTKQHSALARLSDKAILNVTRDKKAVSMRADSLGELKMLAEEHRNKMHLAKILNDKFVPVKLEIRLTVTADIRKEISDPVNQNMISLDELKRMEIDDVLRPEDVTLLNQHEADIVSIRDIYDRLTSKGYSPEDIAVVDRVNEERQAYDIPDGIKMIEYEDEYATAYHYDAALEVLSNTDKPTLFVIDASRKNWFRIKKIDKIDFNELRKEIERYEKVLIAA